MLLRLRHGLYLAIAVCLLHLLRQLRLFYQQVPHAVVTGVIEDLYVHVTSWDEGLSSYRKSITEIVSMARKLNATMVEPCIKDGSLKRCSKREKITLKYSDIFDAGKIRRFVRLITEEDFELAIAAKMNVAKTKMCVHRGSPPAEKICKFPNHYSDSKTIEYVEKAVRDRKTGTSVLEIEHYRKGGFGSLKAKSLDIDSVWGINRELYDKFDKLHLALGLPKNYSVFHWRGEVMSADLMRCAHELLKSRVTRMGNTSTPVYLMSSFSKSTLLQWGGVNTRFQAQQESVNKALDFLAEHNFKKLDSILTEKDTPDLIFLAVYDLIAAEKASDFITCSGSCGGICNECNYDGNFPKLAIEFRTLVSKTSHKCWVT